jgi:SOS-response transcriptional repressor LexA
MHKLKGGDAMIYQHINDLKPISLDAGLAYAKAFDCPLLDISERLVQEAENLTRKLSANDDIEIIPGFKMEANRHRYPIISPVQAGIWRDIVDNYPPGGADMCIMSNNSYGKHTFALRITGNSMEPEFREGDIVIIDPDVRPNAGDYVVAKNHEEAATFKKYRPRGINEAGHEVFELVPLNEDYAPMRSDLQPILIIGTMVEHTRYRRQS